MHPNQMTGLELMQAFAQGLFPRPGISNVMPMEVETIEHGRVVFTNRGNTGRFISIEAVTAAPTAIAAD